MVKIATTHNTESFDYSTYLKKIKHDTKEELKRQKIDYKVYNFCKNFAPGGPLECKFFNQLWSHPDRVHVFTKKNDLTKDFWGECKYQLLDGSHIVIAIFGKTGGGKSIGAQSIGLKILDFSEDILGFRPGIDIEFRDETFREAITGLSRGKVLIKDESGRSSGTDSKIISDAIQNVIEQVRANQNSFILISPNIKELLKTEIVHYYLQIAGKKGVYHCKVCHKEYINIHRCPECKEKTDLIPSKSRTRFIVFKKHPITERLVPKGRIKIPIHNNEEMNTIYKKRKKEHVQYVIDTGGIDNANSGPKEKHVKRLYEFCLEHNLRSKIDMETFWSDFNNSLPDKEKVLGSDSYRDKVIHKVFKKFQNNPVQENESGRENENAMINSKQKEKIDPLKGPRSKPTDTHKERKSREKDGNMDPLIERLRKFIFEFPNHEIIKKAKRQCTFKQVDRDFEIWRRVKKGHIYERIHRDYPGISHISSISKIKTKVQGLVDNIRGGITEIEFHNFLVDSFPEYNEINHEGGTGEPDVYCIDYDKEALHIYSVKNVDLESASGVLDIKELSPELEFAIEERFTYNEVRLFLILIDNSNNNKLIVKEIENFSRTKNLSFNKPKYFLKMN